MDALDLAVTALLQGDHQVVADLHQVPHVHYYLFGF